MPKKGKRELREPEPIRYYFEVKSYVVGYSYSVRNPGTLSKSEVISDYGGLRPEESITFGVLDVGLRVKLLEPCHDTVIAAEIELAAVERASKEREPGVAGLLYRHGGTLTGFCWLPSTAFVSLVILLCDGRRIYVALGQPEAPLSEGACPRHILVHRGSSGA